MTVALATSACHRVVTVTALALHRAVTETVLVLLRAVTVTVLALSPGHRTVAVTTPACQRTVTITTPVPACRVCMLRVNENTTSVFVPEKRQPPQRVPIDSPMTADDISARSGSRPFRGGRNS